MSKNNKLVFLSLLSLVATLKGNDTVNQLVLKKPSEYLTKQIDDRSSNANYNLQFIKNWKKSALLLKDIKKMKGHQPLNDVADWAFHAVQLFKGAIKPSEVTDATISLLVFMSLDLSSSQPPPISKKWKYKLSTWEKKSSAAWGPGFEYSVAPRRKNRVEEVDKNTEATALAELRTTSEEGTLAVRAEETERNTGGNEHREDFKGGELVGLGSSLKKISHTIAGRIAQLKNSGMKTSP